MADRAIIAIQLARQPGSYARFLDDVENVAIPVVFFFRSLFSNIYVLPEPQITAALGAALIAARE